MANLQKVKARIAEIAEGGRKDITVEEIAWVVSNLQRNGYETSEKVSGPGGHGKLFRVKSEIGLEIFSVCTHRKGSPHVKRCYVDVFIKAMIQLGLYE